MLALSTTNMSTTIRISEDTRKQLNSIGGTFDTPDDVIQRLVTEAGYTVPSESNSRNTGTVEHETTELEEELDSILPQSEWLTNPKQRKIVVSVVKRCLQLPSETSVRDRRRQAQEHVLENSDIGTMGTIQDHCGRKLFKGHKQVPNNSWTREFDRVLEQLESERDNESDTEK